MTRNVFIQAVASIALTMVSATIMAQTREVRMPSGNVELLEVERIEARDIIEGDILLSSSSRPSAVVIVDGQGSRWKNGVIPFEIAKTISDENRENIYRAMIEISYLSPVRFVERSLDAKDFVFFTPSEKGICASHVGRKGGKQDIVLSPRCKKGSTMHEILHALGFWHEQSRGDRNNYVDIRWENIKEEKKHNFIRHIDDGIDKGEYDYDSIMHYGAKSFSKNGEDTIVPIIAGKKIGQRDKLSSNDIKILKDLYSH